MKSLWSGSRSGSRRNERNERNERNLKITTRPFQRGVCVCVCVCVCVLAIIKLKCFFNIGSYLS